MIDAIINPNVWENLVKAVGTVMPEMQIKFKPDGLTIEQMSKDKATMIGAKIPKSDFVEYNCTGDHLIILNLEQLTKIAKRLGKATEVGLSFDEDGPDSNLFQLVLTGEDNRKVFNLIVFAPDQSYRDVTVPFDVEFDSEFHMLGSAFESVIKDLLIMASRAKFLVDQKRVVFRGGTDEGNETKIVYDVGKDISSLKKDTEDEPLAATFSLRPLEDLTGAIVDKSRPVVVKMAHEKPLWFEVDLGLDEKSTSRLVIVQAPILDRRGDT
jgi:hypothetical protein